MVGVPSDAMSSAPLRHTRSHAERRQAQRRAQESADNAVRKAILGGDGAAASPVSREAARRESIARPHLEAKLSGTSPSGDQRIFRNVALHSAVVPARGAPMSAWRAAQKGPRLLDGARTAGFRAAGAKRAAYSVFASGGSCWSSLRARLTPVFTGFAGAILAFLALPLGECRHLAGPSV